MKIAIINHFFRSIRFYRQNFTTFLKLLWLPMCLLFVGTVLSHQDFGLSMEAQKKPVSLHILSIVCSLLGSLWIQRTVILFMRGALPLSRLWSSKDRQFILRTLGAGTIVTSVMAVGALILVALFFSTTSTTPNPMIGFVLIGVIGLVLPITLMLFIRYIFYPISVYGECPLTLRQSWRLMDKNVMKMGMMFLLFIGINGLMMVLSSAYFYAYCIYAIFLTLCSPAFQIFYSAVFLTLSKQNNIMEPGKPN